MITPYAAPGVLFFSWLMATAMISAAAWTVLWGPYPLPRGVMYG